MNALDEEQQSLWLLTFAPATWFVHFLGSYVTAAIWCARQGDAAATLGPVQALIAGYTAVALAVIGVVAWTGYRKHTYGHSSPPHDFDSPADRHRFLGFATLLLAGLSGVATLYVGVAAFFFETCR